MAGTPKGAVLGESGASGEKLLHERSRHIETFDIEGGQVAGDAGLAALFEKGGDKGANGAVLG